MYMNSKLTRWSLQVLNLDCQMIHDVPSLQNYDLDMLTCELKAHLLMKSDWRND